MINSDNISFIIQGLIHPYINLQVSELRKHFPHSEVTVSTCNVPNIEIHNADKIIVSPDPGFFYHKKYNCININNVNRQIVSTLAGLKASSKEFSFKLRSDFFITGNEFLTYFDKFPLFDDKYRVFEHKLLASCYFSRNPNIPIAYPLHPSDLAFFGKRSDLINLFDIPLMDEKEAYYSELPEESNRFSPEQYIFTKCLTKNHKEFHLQYVKDVNQINIEETERYFASNFVLLSFEQFNLQYTKKTFDMKANPQDFINCYTHIDWIKLYKKYVSPIASFPFFDKEKLKIKKHYKIWKINLKNDQHEYSKLHKIGIHKNYHNLKEAYHNKKYKDMLVHSIKLSFKVITRFHRIFTK